MALLTNHRLVPNHIAGFAVMYGIFLAFGVSPDDHPSRRFEAQLTCRRKLDLGVSPRASLDILSAMHLPNLDNLGLLASKAIGPTAARGQLYGIAAAIGKGKVSLVSGSHRAAHADALYSRGLYRDLYLPQYHRQSRRFRYIWWRYGETTQSLPYSRRLNSIGRLLDRIWSRYRFGHYHLDFHPEHQA